MHIKAETFMKGAAYVAGSVCTVMLAIPPSQYDTPKTIIICVVAAILALLGFLSRNYANYQDLSKVETTGNELLMAVVSGKKGDDSEPDSSTK